MEDGEEEGEDNGIIDEDINSDLSNAMSKFLDSLLVSAVTNTTKCICVYIGLKWHLSSGLGCPESSVSTSILGVP